jgi:monothiol glutaredoxin
MPIGFNVSVNVELPASTAPRSPCDGTCTLDDARVCIGCGRHVDEIVAWPRLGNAEQWQILERSAGRRAQRVPNQQVTSMNAPSNVVDRIKQQLSSSNVLLYMKGTPDFPQCGFSAAAVQVLNALGAQYSSVNIFEDPELREALKQYSNWPTYPQLYVKGELIGGADIIREMYQSGELQKLLAS